MEEKIQQLEEWRQEAIFKADIFRAQTTGDWTQAALQRDRDLAKLWSDIAHKCAILMNAYHCVEDI